MFDDLDSPSEYATHCEGSVHHGDCWKGLRAMTVDPVFSALVANVNRLGDELDAANDGSLHHAYGDRADMMVEVLNYRYRAAVAELSAYRPSNVCGYCGKHHLQLREDCK